MNSPEQVDLVVTGMTCASCAARIERKLNKLDGVKAAVNYATGIAHVDFGSAYSVENLVETVQAAGYNALAPSPLLDEQVAKIEHEHEIDLRERWMVGAFFAVPTIAIAMIPFLQIDGWQWAALLLATPVVTWSAWPLHVASFRNARHRTTTMDTLVSIGVIAAFAGSLLQMLIATFFNSDLQHTEMSPHIYIDVAVVVPVFVVFGRWLEARNKRKAGSALRALADAMPKKAEVLRDSEFRVVEISEVVIGDVVRVATESTIPVDGKVVQGTSSVSNALLTGESLPIPVQPEDFVQAGAVNFEGELQIEVTAVGATSTLARIASLVAAAQSGKANISRLADRVSAIFVPTVFVITIATGIAWWFIDSGRVLDVMIAVLVIACPCALGLATPTALVVGSGRAATLGFLVAGPEVFENSQKIDAVVFDKTGTLTTGEMQVVADSIPAEFAALTGALAVKSSHPVSVATANRFYETELNLESVMAVPGKGVQATWENRKVEFGSRKLHPELELEISTRTTSWLFIDGQAIGKVEVADTIDSTSKAAVAALHEAGIKVVMASGDNKVVANEIATQLGIEQVHSELHPSDKIAVIENLQAAGHVVVMVGDGSNDAPALAQADIGIAMGRGTGIARATADITLLRPDLMLVPQSIKLSQITLKTIKQNLLWAFGYNIAAIPLAMTGNLNPVIAGIAMSASSVLVVTNSLRLNKKAL